MIVDTLNLETDVIGAICRDQRLIRVVSQYLSPEDFQSSTCATVFEAAVDADSRGKLFDPYIAVNVLNGKVSEQEAQRFIAECIEICVTTANAEEHAKIIRSQADERRLREQISVALGEQSGEKLTDTIAGICSEQIQRRRGGRMKKLDVVMEASYKGLFEKPMNRVDTGYGGLDGLVKGMWGGQLIIIAARPAVGKSAFALSVAENAARKGKVVQFYSLEMDDTEIGEREIARWTDRVTMSEIIERGFDGTTPKDDDLANAFCRSAGLPIYIDDSANVKPSKVRAQAITQKDLGLIIVDYGGLMSSDKKAESRNLELGAISRDLKNIAKELKIPVIMLAQLSRKVGGDDVKPTLTDLRDSGELEQNADKCIFLWNIDREHHKVGVSVAKNRRGKLGEIVMHFDGDHMRFMETEDRYEEPARSGKRGKRGSIFEDDLPVD